ncbi:MAG: TVP38/TMEM64 family protein [Anaerolineae bacterium]|nr:TVP38/TMEM64 family protein [Anaerolineae bacterium]
MNKKAGQTLMTVAHLTIVIALLITVGITYFSQYDAINQENIEAFVRGFGAWTPVAYAILYIICAPIPLLAPIFSAVGGVLFGALWGTLLVIATATVSALVPFSLARRLGREWVAKRLEGKKLDEIYAQSEGEKGLTFVILMRLIPVLPWEIQNYVGGLTRVSVPTFMAGTVIGIIPGSFSLVFLGAAATDPTSWQFAVAVAFKIVVALIPVVSIYLKSRKKRANQAA